MNEKFIFFQKNVSFVNFLRFEGGIFAVTCFNPKNFSEFFEYHNNLRCLVRKVRF